MKKEAEDTEEKSRGETASGSTKGEQVLHNQTVCLGHSSAHNVCVCVSVESVSFFDFINATWQVAICFVEQNKEPV